MKGRPLLPLAGLFYDPGDIEYPPIPLRPTKEQAKAALALLIEPIELFPFVNDASRSVILSGMLTAVIRQSLSTAPLHASTAPVAGSGKSMLNNTISVIATGRPCHSVAETTQLEEFEKRISTALIRGDQIISFDNCTVPIGNGLLCQALTEQFVEIRSFGTLKDVTVENTTLILANGNNLVLAGDIPRRCLLAKLDPQCERPETREFEFSPVAMAEKMRPRLVVAALTILRAYHVASRPDQPVPLGSFEDWSNWVRSALMWLGEPDPCSTMAATRETDPDLKKLDVLLGAWHDLLPSPCTIKRAIEEARMPASGYDGAKSEKRTALLGAMEDVAGERNDINPRRLGKWISERAGRIINSLRFETNGTSQHAVLWQVVKIT